MRTIKLLVSLLLTFCVLSVGANHALAAPSLQGDTPIHGIIERITLETDSRTAIVTVLVELSSAPQGTQSVLLSQESATELGLISLDADGKPQINRLALGQSIEIDTEMVIPAPQEERHPVALALAAFFSDVASYETIMTAHEEGIGFGVIAQALWLTREVGGDRDLFQEVLDAKAHNDYAAFSGLTEDGIAPKNWGQLRNLLLKQKNLGAVISDSDPADAQNPADKEKQKEKEKQKPKDDADGGTQKDKDKEKNK